MTYPIPVKSHIIDAMPCRKCGASVFLMDGHEWPETRHLVYCSSCAIDTIRAQRKEIAFLKAAKKQLQLECRKLTNKAYGIKQ